MQVGKLYRLTQTCLSQPLGTIVMYLGPTVKLLDNGGESDLWWHAFLVPSGKVKTIYHIGKDLNNNTLAHTLYEPVV